MDDLELRIVKIEMELDAVRNSVTSLSGEIMGVKEELHSIQKILNQIKWFAMGATLIYTGSVTGALKLFGVLGV